VEDAVDDIGESGYGDFELGTLFSNLSNDMSSLTDMQGILSQKTGSSSNTNVLELTAASTSASAERTP